MAIDINNPYFRTKVMTASQEELRLMLIEGALRFMREGREAMTRRDWEGVYSGFSQAKAILIELINALRPEVAPELCRNLSSLYTYMYTRLTEGSMQKDIAAVDEVIGLMEYDRETWLLLMDKLAKDKSPGATPAAGVAPAPAAAPAPAPSKQRPVLSIQG